LHFFTSQKYKTNQLVNAQNEIFLNNDLDYEFKSIAKIIFSHETILVENYSYICKRYGNSA